MYSQIFTNVFSAPKSHHRIIDLINNFSRLKSSKSQTTLEELHDIHQKILSEARLLIDPESLSRTDLTEVTGLLDPAASKNMLELFCLALGHAQIIDDVVQGPLGIFESSQSKTLRHHKADSLGKGFPTWKPTAQKLGLSKASIDRIHKKIEKSLGEGKQKSLLIESILDIYNIRSSKKNSLYTSQEVHKGIFAAFSDLFPDHPFLPGEIEIIASGTLIAFCIPFEKSRLLTPRFEKLPEDQKKRVSDYLDFLGKFKQEHFSRFPAFGAFDAHRVNKNLLDKLQTTKNPRWDLEELQSELSRIVSILPFQDIDQFIVHDLWGHGWQGCLVDLDQHYHQIASFNAPLHKVHLGQNKPFLTADLILWNGKEAKWDQARLEQKIYELIAYRLPIALTPVFAEMLADIIEYKFISDHPDLEESMPSSSVYKFSPTKLDLLLTDIPFYFKQAIKSLGRTSGTNTYLTKILEEDKGVPPAQSQFFAQELLKFLQNLWLELEKKDFECKLKYEQTPHADTSNQKISINAFTKVVLNFITIHQNVIHFEEDLHEENPLLRPNSREKLNLKFRDLLALASSLYFMEHPIERLWTIDEYVTLVLKPQCKMLTTFLDPTLILSQPK